MKKGFFILGFPSTGKSTLIDRLDELGIKAIDQDEIKKAIRLLLRLDGWMQFQNSQQDWQQMSDISAAVMLSMADSGIIVTYSDTLDASLLSQRIKDRTEIAFRRDLETTKEKMLLRDGELHPNIDSWTTEWYNEITDMVVDLSPDEYMSDYIGLIEDIFNKGVRR